MSNETLVEVVGDSGTINTDFDLAHAANCLTHRIMLLVAWADLTAVDRAAYIEQSNIGNLMRVGASAERDLYDNTLSFVYSLAGATPIVDAYIQAVTGRLTQMGYDTDEKQFAFAVSLYTPEEHIMAIEQGIIEA